MKFPALTWPAGPAIYRHRNSYVYCHKKDFAFQFRAQLAFSSLLAHNSPKRNLCKAMHLSSSTLVAASAVTFAIVASPANARSLRSTANVATTTAVDETFSTSTPLADQDRRRLEYGIDDLIVGYGNETFAFSTSMQYEYNPSGQSSSSVTVTDANMCVTAEGNSWKAIPIPSNATVSTTDKTVLSFQFSYEQLADINAICLDEDTAFASSGQLRCFAVSAAQGWIASKYLAYIALYTEIFHYLHFILYMEKYFLYLQSNLFYLILSTRTSSFYPHFKWPIDMANVPNMAQNANETYTFDIPVGYFAPNIIPKYLVIIQDEDDLTSTGTTVSAKSKFCNIHLHEKETFSRLHMKINGEDVYLDNDFKAYGISTDDDQDSRNHYLHISEDGAGLQVVGNQWKALELPNGGYDITSSTVLDFFFSFKEQVEFSAICLDSDRARTSTRTFSEKRCFQLSGIDGFHSQHHKMPKTEVANQDTQYKVRLEPVLINESCHLKMKRAWRYVAHIISIVTPFIVDVPLHRFPLVGTFKEMSNGLPSFKIWTETRERAFQPTTASRFTRQTFPTLNLRLMERLI